MTQDDEIADLLIRWEEAWEHGEDLSVDVLCADCPQHQDALARRIAALKSVSWVKNCAEGQMEENGADDEPNPSDLTFPMTLGGRYRIAALIAEGGHGRVFRGFDPELQREVAIKIPKNRPGLTQNRAELLVEEARKLARLRHPGIVSVHDVGRDDGTVFVVSDLIDGENLADRIARNRPSFEEAVGIVAGVADALAFAHDQGFVHRDIKPANILLDRQGKALIADFGIAATLDELARGRDASTGTLAYMAPEQVAGEVQLLDGRTDLYALGVVLYELLTGRHPFPARTPTALREQILFRAPVSLRSLDPSLAPELEATCLRCLAKHPADRFLTARELATALRTLGSGKVTRRRLGRSWLWSMALIPVAALGVTGWMALGRSRPTSDEEPTSIARDGVLVFDGETHIVTPLERFAPVTLEAWVWPEEYQDHGRQTIIGSDIATKWGNGMGISGAIFAAEYISGDIFSAQQVPLRMWSHLATVFGETETRLYFNGRLVQAGPKTEPQGGTHFVIGCVGETNPIDHFRGKMRALRISKGERYTSDFTPEESFTADPPDAEHRAVLIFDGDHQVGGIVSDRSGSTHQGVIVRSDVTAD